MYMYQCWSCWLSSVCNACTIHGPGLDVLAHFCIPVSAIRLGYRKVPLLDHRSERIRSAYLFCRFSLVRVAANDRVGTLVKVAGEQR